jgi:YfiH family protein
LTQSSDKNKPSLKANFPGNVQLISTTRYFNGSGKTCSGKKIGYADFNLAIHVGDNPQTVVRNRAQLIQQFNLPAEPKYLEQVHSNICLDASSAECVGDAVITKEKGVVCAVLTADCLPIFISNHSGTQVGVAHAGWKGVLNGIIEATIAKFNQQDLLVHFGPAISQENFEVGQDVFDQFVNKSQTLEKAFIPFKDKYKLNIYQAASIILNDLGVKNISGGDQCTFAQADQYFSYRRDGAQSGRMAHLIWME